MFLKSSKSSHCILTESKYYSNVIKSHCNQKLVIIPKKNEGFKKSTICCIYDNDYVDDDVKIRHHYDITRKFRYAAHRDFIIKVKLNHKIPIVFHNLKKYESHLIMQGLDKFDFKINVIRNGVEKCTRFNINIELIFIDSFQFLRFFAT